MLNEIGLDTEQAAKAGLMPTIAQTKNMMRYILSCMLHGATHVEFDPDGGTLRAYYPTGVCPAESEVEAVAYANPKTLQGEQYKLSQKIIAFLSIDKVFVAIAQSQLASEATFYREGILAGFEAMFAPPKVLQ